MKKKEENSKGYIIIHTSLSSFNRKMVKPNLPQLYEEDFLETMYDNLCHSFKLFTNNKRSVEWMDYNMGLSLILMTSSSYKYFLREKRKVMGGCPSHKIIDMLLSHHVEFNLTSYHKEKIWWD